jgi:hypothetical protein
MARSNVTTFIFPWSTVVTSVSSVLKNKSSHFFLYIIILFYLLRFPVSVSRFGISFDHTERHTRTQTHRTPLDEGSARRRVLYLTTTHNTHKRQTFMPPVGFEPEIPESGRPQTHALDRAATGIGTSQFYLTKIVFICNFYQFCH